MKVENMNKLDRENNFEFKKVESNKKTRILTVIKHDRKKYQSVDK